MDNNQTELKKQRKQILGVIYGTMLALFIFIGLLADPRSSFLWWLAFIPTSAAVALGLVTIFSYYCLERMDDNG
jgi:hypothetical protein